jgi:SAM-dependent methyltransferase
MMCMTRCRGFATLIASTLIHAPGHPMTLRSLIKRSLPLSCAYYVIDDWRAGRRLAGGNLRTTSGARHVALDLDHSLGYIDRVYGDYLQYAGLKHFSGDVAEIGPGDNFGVALCALAGGAGAVHAIDRWRPDRDDAAQGEIYRALATRPGFADLFNGAPSERSIRHLQYHAGVPAETFFGQSGLTFDAIISRAVLEHLYDPLGALGDMAAALKPGGLLIHRIDLRDHGMFADHHPLTFLTIGGGLWRRMTHNAGRPNRVLLPAYANWIDKAGLEGELLITRLAGVADEISPARWEATDAALRATALATVEQIRPQLARPFRGMVDADLAAQGCVLVARKPAHQD